MTIAVGLIDRVPVMRPRQRAATAVVVATGTQTYFGSMASSIIGQEPETSFDKGVRRFMLLMVRFILVMVPLVFLINGLTKHNWREAFFFSLAVAVGLTPEMLPMIVSVCLSNGALAMSKKKVIVKRLNSIQNFGAMDVLCTDKTGTLTLDRVILERHCDVPQKENEEVLLDAYLIAHFQTGLRNVLDGAVLTCPDAHEKLSIENYRKVDEIPFDFMRRMMSVVVETPAKQHRILTKGAPESVFGRCTFFELERELYQMEPILIGDLIELYQDLSMDGFRVLAVAYKDLKSIPTPHPLNMLADAQSVVMRQARTIKSSNCEQPAQQRSASLCQLVSAGSRPELIFRNQAQQQDRMKIWTMKSL